MSSTFDERIPLSLLHLQGVRGRLQSREGAPAPRADGMPRAGDSPRRFLWGRRGWLLFEKLPQADAEALEDSGFDSVVLGAGLCDLEHAVPEL